MKGLYLQNTNNYHDEEANYLRDRVLRTYNLL